MNDIFGWLIKLLFFVMLAPFFIGLALSLASAAFVALLPWLIATSVLIGLTAGGAAALVLRRRLPLRPDYRFPPGEIPRYRRSRGIRTDR
jgi:hypothetical protein